jgi:hypothetical protein
MGVGVWMIMDDLLLVSKSEKVHCVFVFTVYRPGTSRIGWRTGTGAPAIPSWPARAVQRRGRYENGVYLSCHMFNQHC